ncbi:AAA family ATPase [Nonomuraea typhae]|uniref:AAA family ATPase n=1 Tax=Nonomuraea typhae TaxID=2603600 RepID=UPI001CA5196B|nr:AAA family ATPase [Nonomuraea typhae]
MGRSGNLPAETTSFVGRTRLLAGLERQLAGARLVTATGIGGVGKSRTALRLAHQLRSQYADGVWFADLARLRDAGVIRHEIAGALGIADPSSRAASESLITWVRERGAMLLVLDNCEHLVQSCADLVEDLLEANPGLRILATSRRPLNLPYERVVPLPAMQVPGDAQAESLFANESVQLFAARAGVIVPDFVLDEDNITPVAELCRRLDGIPLAIELAAVRLRALSVERILGLLTDRFSLLAGAGRVALPRHQTLRAAIGWSHELCGPEERLLWARLSVFAGDFELDAARFVCADSRLSSEAVTGLVAGLVEKSILLIRGNHAGVRYQLIDTLAEYGGEWLHKLGETERMRHKHLQYYLALAQRSEDAWSGPRQIYWFVRMRQEHDNVRVALEHARCTPGEGVLALKLLSSLWFMWICCGLTREGGLYLERSLEANPDLGKERCKALWVLSYVRSAQGDGAGALQAAEQCSSEAVRIGDSNAVILATKMQGTAALVQGDLQKAAALLGVAIEFSADNKELNPGLLPAIVELSNVLTAQGALGEAEALAAECLQVCKERGELWTSSNALWALALARLAGGRAGEALEDAREALRVKRYFHGPLDTLRALATTAQIFSALGQPLLSVRILGALQQNWKSAGLPPDNAPWLTREHDALVRACRKELGGSAYQQAFTYGERLDLNEITDLVLGDLEEEQAAGLEIRVAAADDDSYAKVERAVRQMVNAFGFDTPPGGGDRGEPYLMKFRGTPGGTTADEQFALLDQALRAETTGLAGVFDDVSHAVVMIDQTLVVRSFGKTVHRRLSAAEQAYVRSNRHLFDDPEALVRELDRLPGEPIVDQPRHLNPEDRPIVVGCLGEDAAGAVEAWAETADYEIRVNRPLWVRRGFTESRLISLMIVPPAGSGERTTKVIAKLCPPGPLSREPVQHQRAWNAAPKDFRRDHLVGLRPHSPRLREGGFVLLLEIAGGSLAGMCQMAELSSPAELVACYRSVVEGLLGSWNRHGPDPSADLDSGEYLRAELRQRFVANGKLHIWAKRRGLLDPERRWLVFSGERDRRVLPNPLAMAVRDLAGPDRVQYLRGYTHGDLHLGNVLIPRTRAGELMPDRFRLVDLTTYAEGAPLTRDPAMLLLSIVARRVPRDPQAQEDLFDQIIRGGGHDDLIAPMTRVLHEAEGCGPDFRDDWLTQLPLSLQAAALTHCTFGDLDEDVRWWFFRLAARCGAEYLRFAGLREKQDESPALLKKEEMGGFDMTQR